MIGKTLGHYQITNQLGKGGMGEVYQAKDQKLARDVAIKALPEEFARDADRVVRFQREAKLLASLNHPNIAAIYGLEESGGTNFLVLELVEGDTLGDQIKRGPIPVEESLRLATQIADALEAAHEKGIIHRDLKPANIKVTQDGRVKVLDFGLAKAFAGEQADPNLSNSPTLSNAATQQGIILGTAAYMSPEQARGRAVDKRADIWAFGCVLYEMLTARPAFQGEDVSETLASVIKGDVKLDLIPASIHPTIREVISRCLQKDLRTRYRDVGDVRFELEQVLADSRGGLVRPTTTAESRTKLRTILPWAIAAILMGGLITGIAVWKLRPAEPRHVTRLYHELPQEQQFNNVYENAIAVSPDGRQFAYCATGGLFLRRLDELDARLLAGTEGAEKPFFSPDGNWVGYWSAADKQLKKIAVQGGVPVPLSNVPSLGAYSWGADDTIVFSRPSGGIYRLSADGGTPELIIKNEKNELFIAPQILMDGKAVMFTNGSSSPVRTQIQSIKSADRKDLFTGDNARYLPTGHVVFASEDGNLSAAVFDKERLELQGTPIPLTQGVFRASGAPQYAVSDSGTLVYIPVEAVRAKRTLVWVDRNGKEEPADAPPNVYSQPRISPDGRRIAVVVEGANIDICVWSLDYKTLTRVTLGEAHDEDPLWTPDGKRIAFSSDEAEVGAIKWKSADGIGTEGLLSSVPERALHPYSWAENGKILITSDVSDVSEGGFGIGAISMDGDRKWRVLLDEKFNEFHPRISPNGNWLAYVSDESGRKEVYVRPFPEVNKEREQISQSGGDSPLWSHDSRELFYRAGDTVVAVSVKTGKTFRHDAPRTLFQKSYLFDPGIDDACLWDIHPDGKRFLMIKESTPAPAGGGPRKINVVLNWAEELKQRVPKK
jgi:eukaryotic-like serine/threonine-protein kinase